MMPPPNGKPPVIIPANSIKPVSMLKPQAEISKENIDQPYGYSSKPKFVPSKPASGAGGYVPSAMGGEGRVKRGSMARPQASDPFAKFDAD